MLPRHLPLIVRLYMLPFGIYNEINGIIEYISAIVCHHPIFVLVSCSLFLASGICVFLKFFPKLSKSFVTVCLSGLTFIFFVASTLLYGQIVGPYRGFNLHQNHSEDFKLAFNIEQPTDAKRIRCINHVWPNSEQTRLLFHCNTTKILPFIERLYPEVTDKDFKLRLGGRRSDYFFSGLTFSSSIRYFVRLHDPNPDNVPSREGFICVDPKKGQVIAEVEVVKQWGE